MARFRISYNAPVVLTFALAAAIIQLLGDSAKQYVIAYPEFHGGKTYLGLVTHILGHANWDHLLGNFAMILLIGPILEERHGSFSLLVMILITALVTGIINVTFSDTALLGASGIVFMMILLASTANIRQGEIPLTFIAVAVLFLGREVVHAFRDDQISQMGHLIGGLAGGAFGFLTAAGSEAKVKAIAPGPARPSLDLPRPPRAKPGAKP